MHSVYSWKDLLQRKVWSHHASCQKPGRPLRMKTRLPLALIGNSSRLKAVPKNPASLAASPTQVVFLLYSCAVGIITNPALNEIAYMEFSLYAGHMVPRQQDSAQDLSLGTVWYLPRPSLLPYILLGQEEDAEQAISLLSNSASCYIPKRIKSRISERCLHTRVLGNFIHNSQVSEAAQMSIDEWTDK